MIGDHSSSFYTKKVRVAEVLELQATSNVRWFEQIIVSINEVEEVIALQIRCLKCHLLFIGKVITFEFLAKVPGEFIWKNRSWPEKFGFNIDNFVEVPIAVTWIFPKLNVILWMMIEEKVKLF